MAKLALAGIAAVAAFGAIAVTLEPAEAQCFGCYYGGGMRNYYRPSYFVSPHPYYPRYYAVPQTYYFDPYPYAYAYHFGPPYGCAWHDTLCPR